MNRLHPVFATLLWIAAPALADWTPGDPHKMHFPQLPDPFGWDVEFVGNELADDWLCTSTGAVSDVHFWMSWAQDHVGVLSSIELAIYADDRSNPDYSQPGTLLWSDSITNFTVVDPYGTGNEGFWDPSQGTQPPAWRPDDHFTFQQVNIEGIDDPFIQTAGQIYWLGISVNYPFTQWPSGWKTSLEQFEDVAVWRNTSTPWTPLYDPQLLPMEVPLSLSFVITPEPATGAFLLIGSLVLMRRRR
jgi:hypothetical protein